ncbi:MAG: NADH-quinone oxidoreductase subunit K, partial [Gemmatimonadota bacterium]
MLQAYLGFATLLFGIGLYGLLQRRSLVAMLIALELMLAAVSINVVALT